MTFTRYIIAYKTHFPYNSILYVAIGLGSSTNIEEAHLYTSCKLAERKAKYYQDNPQWYRDVEIIPAEVTILK